VTTTGPQIIGARRFADDSGGSDPALRSMLSAYAKGGARDREVLSALGAARLLVPVVALAVESETGPSGLTRDKRSEVALPIMIGDDGRRGVLAFTSVDTLHSWRRDARPVPAYAGEACQAVLDEGADALVIDVAGPVTYAVQGHFLRTFAEHGHVPEARTDPQVLAAIYRITHPEADIDRVRVLDSDRADVSVRLELVQRDDAVVRRVAERLARDLRPLLPGGVELSAVVRAKRSSADEPPGPQG
jgi:hypothetical protein